MTEYRPLVLSGTKITVLPSGDSLDSSIVPSPENILHADLSGLDADDHPIYYKADGTRSATGVHTFEDILVNTLSCTIVSSVSSVISSAVADYVSATLIQAVSSVILSGMFNLVSATMTQSLSSLVSNLLSATQFFSNDIHASTLSVSADAFVSGNLTVSGDLIANIDSSAIANTNSQVSGSTLDDALDYLFSSCSMYPGHNTLKTYTQSNLITFATHVVSATAQYYAPICICHTTTFDRFYINVTAGTGNAADIAKVGIYSNNKHTGRPQDLIVSGQTDISLSSAAARFTVINAVLEPGWYWLSFYTSSTGASVTGHNANGLNIIGGTAFGLTTHLRESNSTGELPAVAGSLNGLAETTGTGVAMFLRAS